MASISTEFKVGLFTLVCVGLVGAGYVFTMDGLRADEAKYTVHLKVPSADGLWVGTPVRLAGVDIGAVTAITVDGNRARLDLAIREAYQLPEDTTAELASTGLLGDRHVRIQLGDDQAVLADGAILPYGEEPGDLDNITRQVELITEDVQAITKVLREMVEDDANRDHVEASLANIDALSNELRLLAEQNRHDINAIVDSVGRLTTSLEGFTNDTRDDVNVEMDKLHDATDKLDSALADIESITSKLDEGQGTLGALINDDETIDALNDTIDNANQVIESFSGLHARVYYTGRVYFGSQPSDLDTFFYGNPIAPNLDGGLGYSGSNTLGIELRPQQDFWWVFEINDYPNGVVRATDYYYPDSGQAFTEWSRDISYRFTFQLEKRWYNTSFRIGVKESGGGIGMTVYTLKDRLRLSADAFDFAFGSYPDLDSSGLPNVRVAARWEPIDHMYAEIGTEQVLLGLKHDYFTGYGGLGFHFDDDDIKLLLATLPLGF